ncbi:MULTISPECIES: hypothetical protein [Methylomonas]|uniref:hypothetical protein n=1 Tax=Methylomonas TaxID=416 RepID=UPI001231A2FD|nr:hypothetical protein [Methylomonas rhizoryzae]
MFDLTDVSFVKRIVVGNNDPERMQSEAEIQQAAALLNRCLSEPPKGRIIGIEKTFSILNIGEHQVVLQCLIYHVGFSRKPYWLEDTQ